MKQKTVSLLMNGEIGRGLKVITYLYVEITPKLHIIAYAECPL